MDPLDCLRLQRSKNPCSSVDSFSKTPGDTNANDFDTSASILKYLSTYGFQRVHFQNCCQKQRGTKQK